MHETCNSTGCELTPAVRPSPVDEMFIPVPMLYTGHVKEPGGSIEKEASPGFICICIWDVWQKMV